MVIQCDEARPACSQCVKSRPSCPGYRDEADLIFRDVTEDTKRKANRSAGANRGSSPLPLANDPIQQPTTSQEEEGHSDQLSNFISRPLSPSLEQQALCFLSNYVLIPRQPYCSRGYLEYLLPLYRSSGPDCHLSLAVSAVAIASFGSRPDAKALLRHARQRYGKALCLTNAALRDPIDVKTDSTLMAVMLLGLYEVRKSRSPKLLASLRRSTSRFSHCKTWPFKY
jgi:hypothetical protein